MPSIERIEDRFDPRISEFRRQVCRENGAGDEFFNLSLDRHEVDSRYGHLPPQNIEEIWKFGPHKWEKTEFSNLECLIDGGKVVGVSGCRVYLGGLLRTSMHLYTLKQFRASCAGMQFAPEGMFSRHLNYARERGDIRALFMTVYPYTPKLSAHVRNLGVRRLSLTGKPMLYLKDFLTWPETISFHGVPQNFFIYPIVEGFQFDGKAPQLP